MMKSKQLVKKGNGAFIDVRDVHKVYDLGVIKVNAVNGISFQLERGDFVSLMGPSGSGKSTLFNMLGTLDTPTGGDIIINNKSLSSLSESERTRFRSTEIGFVFQFYNLVPVLNAFENVVLPLAAAGKKAREQKGLGESALQMVGLESRMTHRPHELSGGEQQRVCIARALIGSPAIVLADEPTGNLDQETGYEIMSLFRRLNKEQQQTFLIITHDPAIASLTDRTLYIEDGVIIQDLIQSGEKKQEVKATSITDRVYQHLKSKQRNEKVNLEKIAAELDVDLDEMETIIERMMQRNVLTGYIEDQFLIVEKIRGDEKR